MTKALGPVIDSGRDVPLDLVSAACKFEVIGTMRPGSVYGGAVVPLLKIGSIGVSSIRTRSDTSCQCDKRIHIQLCTGSWQVAIW